MRKGIMVKELRAKGEKRKRVKRGKKMKEKENSQKRER